MSSGHSYETYENWSVSPPFVAGVLGAFVLITVTLIHKCNQGRSSQYSVDLLFHFAKVTFGDRIKKEHTTQKFTFYSREISSLQISFLSTITLMVLQTTFFSFWISFLFNETFVCDPQLDCFLRDPSSLIVLSSEPLDNCTSYDGTNGTVVCFQFIFDLSKGFSSAVGFMAVAVVYCRLYISIMIWLQKFCSNKYQMYIMHIVIGLIILSIIIVVFAVPFFSDVVFKTFKSETIFITYLLSFGYIGPFAGVFVNTVIAKAVTTSNNAQVKTEEEKRFLGASVNRSNYTNLPQDT